MSRLWKPLAACVTVLGLAVFAQAQRPVARPPTYRPPAVEPYRPPPSVRPVPHEPLTPSYRPPTVRPGLPEDHTTPSIGRTPSRPGYEYDQRIVTSQTRLNIIQQETLRSPRMGVDALARHRDELLPEHQVLVTRQIVHTLGTQVEATTDPWQARRLVADVQDQFRRQNLQGEGLAELQARVNRRCLGERLADVSAQLIAGNTQEAARLTEQTLTELTGKPGSTAELGRGGELAADVIQLNRQRETLSQLETAFQGDGPQRRTQLLGVDARAAPEAVTLPLGELRDLETLRASLARPEAGLPAVDRIEAGLAPTARAAGDDPAAVQLRQDVSARLFLEGRAGDARKVLAGGAPGADSPEHAAALLRDMKAVVLGEGSVATAAVADVVAPEPGTGGATPRGPPPVVRDLAPEGRAADWKPPVRESPLADLGPVPTVERLEGKVEGRVETEVRQAALKADERTRDLAGQIRTFIHHVPQPVALGPNVPALSQRDEEERKNRLAAEMEKLGRPLTAEERAAVLARPHVPGTPTYVQPSGNGPATPNAVPGSGDDDEFLAEVIEALGRPLTAEERRQVRAWHHAGKAKAEVVALLGGKAEP